ncbi:hypothetical protein [Haliea sp. E17]|uniref:hypothetical protein n=1 Tax=Haliea sp. E17 TaxID=3401576 RepID=UPI003AAA6AB2
MNAVQQWLQQHPLAPVHVDCATAVMLKILDGKCKMGGEEKRVMAQLYHAVSGSPGEKLGADIRELIARAGTRADPEMREVIYERRVLAETVISRPVMKAFKRMIREQGLFALLEAESAIA